MDASGGLCEEDVVLSAEQEAAAREPGSGEDVEGGPGVLLEGEDLEVSFEWRALRKRFASADGLTDGRG